MVDKFDSLVLEVFRGERKLKMCLFAERELARTVRHYSQCPVNFEDVQRICQDIRRILDKARSKNPRGPELLDQLKKSSRLLWEQLLTRPVKEELKSCPARNLVLSLEEELVSIPWELLFDGEQFLCLRYNVGRLIRSEQKEHTVSYRSPAPRVRMLILANPTGDLTSAYDEGINIRNQFDRARKKIAIDFKSTSIDTLFVRRSLREYDVVHFAGHCEYDPDDPQKIGWVFRDGRFSALDIIAMAEDNRLPSLVFSNACHSAQVNTTGIERDYQEKTYSLAAAFLFSGVRLYIGAIQRVEDPMSFLFAREFYACLIRGRSVGECMRLGRLRLVKEQGLDSLLWASHILYGDPDFRMFRAKRAEVPERKKILSGFVRAHRRRMVAACCVAAGLLLAAGMVLALRSMHPTARYLLRRAERLFQDGRNMEVIQTAERIIAKDPGLLEVYPLVADTFSRLGRREEALKFYFDYIFKSQEADDDRHLANGYIQAGWLYHAAGEYPKAYEFYAKAIELSRQKKDRLHEAVAMRKMAVWYLDKEDNDRALELLTKSAEINRDAQSDPEHRYNLACDYFDLGLLFFNISDLAQAKEFYAKSLKTFEALDRVDQLSDYYFNLGEIYLDEKQFQKALASYRKGLEIDQKQGNLPSLSSDFLMIGELYVEMDDLVRAEENFKLAESIALKINAPMEVAAAQHALGALYKRQGQKRKAREYLRAAEEILRGIDTPAYKAVQADLLTLDGPR